MIYKHSGLSLGMPRKLPSILMTVARVMLLTAVIICAVVFFYLFFFTTP
jgi:hypothetical protein